MFPRPIALFITCTLAAGFLAPPSRSQDQAATVTPAAPDASELRFTGEVLRGQPFTRDIGHKLFFRLTPATSDEGGGWVIEILPPVEPAGDPVEFSEIATPPYHAYNDRYIAAAFGYSSKEAVQATVRKFNFVLSEIDEQRANEVVNAALYPSTVPEPEKARIAAEAAALNLGTGELRIVRSHINTGKVGAPDTIASIRFEVILKFSPGLSLEQVLAPHPPAPKH